jgi:hypothetical protein
MAVWSYVINRNTPYLRPRLSVCEESVDTFKVEGTMFKLGFCTLALLVTVSCSDASRQPIRDAFAPLREMQRAASCEVLRDDGHKNVYNCPETGWVPGTPMPTTLSAQ